MPAYWLGLRRGAFTCVGWQVTLRDPMWQVTSSSCEMEYPLTAIRCFTFFYQSRMLSGLSTSDRDLITYSLTQISAFILADCLSGSMMMTTTIEKIIKQLEIAFSERKHPPDRHLAFQSLDHSIRHTHDTGGLLEPSFYLQTYSRYSTAKF